MIKYRVVTLLNNQALRVSSFMTLKDARDAFKALVSANPSHMRFELRKVTSDGQGATMSTSQGAL